MNVRDANAGAPPSRNELYAATVNDPNAALWASITPTSDPSLSTKVRRRAAAFSPDMLAHRLRLALPRIFVSHAIAFYAVLGGAMVLGASVGLVGFAAADALTSETSSASEADAPEANAPAASARRVVRETPSLRPAAIVAAPATRVSQAVREESSRPEPQTLTTTASALGDEIDTPAAAPRAKRQHAYSQRSLAKKKAKRAQANKKRVPSRRATKGRTRNEKARALARALGN